MKGKSMVTRAEPLKAQKRQSMIITTPLNFLKF